MKRENIDKCLFTGTSGRLRQQWGYSRWTPEGGFDDGGGSGHESNGNPIYDPENNFFDNAGPIKTVHQVILNDVIIKAKAKSNNYNNIFHYQSNYTHQNEICPNYGIIGWSSGNGNPHSSGNAKNSDLKHLGTATAIGADVNSTTWKAMSKIAGASKVLGKIATHGTVIGAIAGGGPAVYNILSGKGKTEDYIDATLAAGGILIEFFGVGEAWDAVGIGVSVVTTGYDIYKANQQK